MADEFGTGEVDFSAFSEGMDVGYMPESGPVGDVNGVEEFTQDQFMTPGLSQMTAQMIQHAARQQQSRANNHQRSAPPARPKPPPYPAVIHQPQPNTKGYPYNGYPHYPPPTQIGNMAPVIHAVYCGPMPVSTVCRSCQAQISTRISYVNGGFVWLIFFLLLCFLVWPFCLLPFFLSSCQDVEHYCPNCNVLVGTYRRM